MLKLLRIFGFIAKHFDLGNWLAKSAPKIVHTLTSRLIILWAPDYHLVFWAIYCWCNHPASLCVQQMNALHYISRSLDLSSV